MRTIVVYYLRFGPHISPIIKDPAFQEELFDTWWKDR